MCQAACENDVDALLAWQMAGANLCACDYNGISPLQAALQKKSQNVILFLKNRGNADTVEIENGPAAVDGEVFSKELGITHHKDHPSPSSPSNENKD